MVQVRGMYTFDGRIRYSETDSDGKLTMSALLNYFQDCSTFQSEDLGLGVAYLKERHLVWVLSAWQIAVERYPVLGERVTVGTAPYGFKSFFGYRNFVMRAESGEYLARANSLWCLLDTDTWRPTAPPEEMKEKYVIAERLDMEYAPRKIAVPETGVRAEPVVVKEHHLDTNHHVNNGQYVDIAMDFLRSRLAVRQLRVEYRKQALLGDVLYPYLCDEGDRFTVSLDDGEGKPYAVAEFTFAGS